MPIGQSKAIWQCKWHNLEANFGTKQCKWRNLMTKFWTSLQQMRKYILKRNTNLIERNIANLKLRNMRASQSRFSSQTEQTLSTVSWFWFLPEEVGRVHAHLLGCFFENNSQKHNSNHHRTSFCVALGENSWKTQLHNVKSSCRN